MANKIKRTPITSEGVAKLILIWIVNAYVFLMLAIYPLFFKDKYYDMCDAKWEFYKYVSAFFGVGAVLLFIWYVACIISKNKIKEFLKNAYKNMVLTDIFVLAYMLIVCISTILTPYKRYVIWGHDGWYMGLVAQLSFCIIYFFVSRFWRWDSTNLFIFIISAFAVFFLAVIMRFRIDPMDMYVGLDDYYLQHFLSTLGQTTWYSSYMCIVFPLGIVAYWCADKLWKKIAFGMFSVIGSLTAVTQNSDSAYIAILGIFFMLFWISFESDEKFLRFLECMIITLGSFKAMGILQKLFADKMVGLDKLSIFMSQSLVTTVMLLAVIICYFVMRCIVFEKTGFHITSIKSLRVVILILAIIGMIGTAIYVWLNTTGRLPEHLTSKSNYLVFDDTWGNNRGVSWRCSVSAYLRGNIIYKLFGVGPDNFPEYLYAYYKSDFDNILGDKIVQICAHNEWLNSLINNGLFGLIAYLGIFVFSFKDCMKEAKNNPYLYGVAIAIVAYILHNFFCYQQIICTPTIFIFMGMAYSLMRFGYEDEYESALMG